MGQSSFSWPCQAAVYIISQLMSAVCVCVRDQQTGPYTGLFIRLNPLCTIDCLAVDKRFGPRRATLPGTWVSLTGWRTRHESNEQHRLLWFDCKKNSQTAVGHSRPLLAEVWGIPMFPHTAGQHLARPTHTLNHKCAETTWEMHTCKVTNTNLSLRHEYTIDTHTHSNL